MCFREKLDYTEGCVERTRRGVGTERERERGRGGEGERERIWF